jgi:hypothetical protein
VVNKLSRTAVQTIALNDDYDFRYPVLEEGMRNKMREQALSAKGAS